MAGTGSTEFKFMKQEIRALRIAIAVILLMTAMAAAFSYSWSRKGGIETLQGSAEDRLKHVSLGVFAPTDKYAYLPNVISRYQIVREALQHPRDARRIREANILLEHLNADTGSTIIYLIALDGRTIAASNWNVTDSLVGNNYAFRPYFNDALRDGAGRFYGVGVTTAVPGYYISHLVKSGDTVLGVVVVKIDIRELAAGWNASRDDVVLTDKNGVIFLSSRDDWKYRPMSPLPGPVKERLKRTRQYESVLKEALTVTSQKELSADERIISILEKDSSGAEEAVSYFEKSRAIPGSEWTIRMLTPMAGIEANARRAAMLAIGAIGLVILSFLCLYQVRVSSREREEARVALEQALQALEEEHGNLQAVSEELRRASTTDPLTGAFNRRHFLESVEKLAGSADRHRHPLSLVLIDADHFKRVNDVHGHPAGDKVLQMLADVYRKELRDADVFARFGGEEFIIALPHTDIDEAQAVAERLRLNVMNQPVDTDGGPLSITVSSGVSQYRFDEDDIQDTIKRADEALYDAKNAGRNRVAIRR